MTPYASVVIPTHDRASTLATATASVQRQTVSDIEIIIAGDGVTPEVRAIAQGLASSDPRVRFIDAPKAPRGGRPNRDHAVRSASAERVFYTDDDDLWLPSHVETLGPLLDRGDIADTLVASVGISGRLHVSLVDNSEPRRRQQPASVIGKTVFDTHLAHRKSAYLGLNTGWGDGSVGGIFAAFARCPTVRWESRGVVTALSLHGAPRRADMTEAERRAEIDHWFAQLRVLEGEGVPSTASPAWWAFRSVYAFGGAPPIREGFADISADQSFDHAWSVALARGRPCSPEAERLLPFLLDCVTKDPPFADLAANLVSALGADRARRAVRRLRDGDSVLQERARFLEAHILATSGWTTEAEQLLTHEPTGGPALHASWLRLRAALRLATDPSAAAALAVCAAQLMPHDRHAWQVAFDYSLRAGETKGAKHCLKQFADLISRDERLESSPGKRAKLLAKRHAMKARLVKLQASESGSRSDTCPASGP